MVSRMSLCVVITVLAVSSHLTNSLVIQDPETLQQVDVEVNYGNELDNIVSGAVKAGNAQDVLAILFGEIGLIQERIRERGFVYMAEGVNMRGHDIVQTRAIIDSVKSEMEDMVSRLEEAKYEINLLLKEIPLSEPGMLETILDILHSLREVPSITEEKYASAITGGYKVTIHEYNDNRLRK